MSGTRAYACLAHHFNHLVVPIARLFALFSGLRVSTLDQLHVPTETVKTMQTLDHLNRIAIIEMNLYLHLHLYLHSVSHLHLYLYLYLCLHLHLHLYLHLYLY